MTTIAYKAGILAADTQQTESITGIKQKVAASKIHICPEGETWSIDGEKVIAFALAGDLDTIVEVTQQLKEGIHIRFNGEKFHRINIRVIFIGEKKEFLWVGALTSNPNQGIINNWITRQNFNSCLAAGSGMSLAQAAMAIGKSAEGAVKVAAKLDPNTNFEVHTFKHPSLSESKDKE